MLLAFVANKLSLSQHFLRSKAVR